MFLWISIIIATIAIQIPNIWAIKKFEHKSGAFSNALALSQA